MAVAGTPAREEFGSFYATGRPRPVCAEGELEDLSGALLFGNPPRNPVSLLWFQNQIGRERIDSLVRATVRVDVAFSNPKETARHLPGGE